MADDRCTAWRVVGLGHIDSHGCDGQAEGDKGECLHGFITVAFMPQCDRRPAAVLTQTVSGR